MYSLKHLLNEQVNRLRAGLEIERNSLRVEQVTCQISTWYLSKSRYMGAGDLVCFGSVFAFVILTFYGLNCDDCCKSKPETSVVFLLQSSNPEDGVCSLFLPTSIAALSLIELSAIALKNIESLRDETQEEYVDANFCGTHLKNLRWMEEWEMWVGDKRRQRKWSTTRAVSLAWIFKECGSVWVESVVIEEMKP